MQDSKDQDVFLLVDDFRLFKYTRRATHHFSHLHQHSLELKSANAEVLTLPCQVGTKLHFVYKHYRAVFVLDASPSLALIDSGLCKVLFEALFESVMKCLTAMVQTLMLPCGKNLDLGIFVSVVTQDASSSPVKFLLQAQLVNRDNLAEVLLSLKKSLQDLEHGWAKSTSRLEQERRLTRKAEKKKGQLGRAGIEEKGSRGTGVSRDLQDRTSIDLRSLLQNGMFALARMPDSACPLMILVTDGVLSLPEKSGGGYDDGMLSQLIQQDISVSVLQITSSTFRNDFHFGYVPDSDMMKFLSRYTGGMFCDLEELPYLLTGENGESRFQQQMFIRRSALTKSAWDPVDKTDIFSSAIVPRKETLAVSRLRMKHYSLNLDVHRLIECRAGEGFKNAHLEECAVPSETVAFPQLRMSITLLLEWKHKIFIEYTFSFFCFPPVAKAELLAESQVDVEIHVTADSEFLMQLANYQAERKATRGLSAVARKKKGAVVADESLMKLWSFVVEIVKTDAMLRVLNEVTQPTEVCSLQPDFDCDASVNSSSFISKKPTVCISSSPSEYFHSYGASSPTYSLDEAATPYSSASSYYANATTPLSVVSVPFTPPHLAVQASNASTFGAPSPFALHYPLATPMSYAPSSVLVSPAPIRPRRLSTFQPDYTSPEHSLWKIVRNYSSEVWRRWFHILNLELLCCMHEADVRRANSQIRALSFVEGGRSSGDDIALGLQRLDHGVSDAVYNTLASWCSVVLADDLFVAFLPSHNSGSRSRSTSFCLIRTSWPTKFLANIQLGFFATNPEVRYAVMETLKWRIASAYVTVTSVEFGKAGPENEDGCLVFPDEDQIGLRVSKRLVKPFGFTNRGIVPILLQPQDASDVNEKVGDKGTGDLSPNTSAQKNLSLRLLRSYMRHHTWTWTLSSPESTALGLSVIRALRTEEGFVLVSSNRRSTSWLREISLSQGMSDKTVVSIIQFAVVQTDAHTLQTELWMEPHFGFYRASDGKMGESKTDLPSSHLFDAISSWLHSCDLHVMSALATFDAIRDIEFDTGDRGLQPSALGLLLELKQDFRFDPSFSYYKDSFGRFHDHAVYGEAGQRTGGTGVDENKKPNASGKKEKRKAKTKNGAVPLTLTYLLECSVAVPTRFLLPSVPLESNKPEELDKQFRSFNTLLGLSVNSMRVMSDLELIQGRVFGQLFNEYTMLFFLLPRPCQLSNEVEDPDPLSRYLDNLLASFFVGTAPVSPVTFPPPSISKLDHHLPILIFVCSRDHLAHPKTLPAVLCTPPIDISVLDPVSSEGSLAAAIASAVESGKTHCGLSDGRPVDMKSSYEGTLSDIENLNAVIASVFASSLVFAEMSHALPPVPVMNSPESKYQPTDTIQPHLPMEDAPFSGLAVTESLQNILTEDTKLYIYDFFHRFRNLNHRNFVTGLYLNLVEQLPIAKVDWQTALQTCVEYTTEVDISLVQISEDTSFNSGISERLTSKVDALISSRFRRYGETNYYYYVPPEISKEISEDDEFSMPSMDDISNPFFLRLEVEANGNPIRVPVRADTPLDKVEPVRARQSANSLTSGRVLLRLNCVSLSPISVFFEADITYATPDPILMESSIGNVSNNSLASLGSVGKKRQLRIKVESQRNFKAQRDGIPRINSARRWPQKSSLSNMLSVSDTTIPEMQDVDLSDEDDENNNTSSEESESPEPARSRPPLKASQSMINLNQLEPRHSFASEELNTAIAPQYTFDQLPQHIAVAMEKLKSDLQALVAEEILLRFRTMSLSDSNQASTVLTIIRDQMNRLPDGALFTETLHLNFVPSIIQIARSLFPSELALHPLQFTLIQLDDGPVLVADRSYWLILVLTADAVHVCTHVSSMNQDEIQIIRRDVRAAVEETCEKINQTCLLTSLNETRNASDLLIAYDPERDRDIPQDEDDSPTKAIATQRPFLVRSAWPLDEPGLYQRPAFESGQFACPCVLSLRFSLHDRLKSELALQSIALFPLTINNRRNVYLYKEQTSGHVFYFLLSSQPLHETKDEAYAVFGQVPWESTRWLYLDVFGVDSPSEEIREQLAALVLSRLNDLSLKCIHNLLALNPLFKLLPVDHQFIRPPFSAPLRSLLFPLAFAGTTLEVKDPYLYMLYLKQNVKFLNQLCLAQSDIKTSTTEGTFKPTDFFFVHHIYGEKQKALGLSTVYFSLLRQNCAGPVCDLPTNPVDSLNIRQEFSNNSALRLSPQTIAPVAGGISSARDEEQAEQVWDLKPEQEAPWYLVVEVWSRGQVDLDELIHLLTESINLALHDYMVETLLYCHRALPKEPVLEKLPSDFTTETLNPCLALLQSSLSFNAPAVQRLEVDLPLCKWSLPRLMREFRNIVFGLNAHLNPLSFVASSDRKSTELVACKSEAGEVVTLLQKKASTFLLLGGFDFGQAPSTAGEDSGQSDDSDRDDDFKKPEHSRGVVLEPKRAQNEMLTPGFSNPKHLYHRHLTYPCQRTACGRRQTGSFKERGKEGGVHMHALARNSVVVFSVSDRPRKVVIWTYNWHKGIVDRLAEDLSALTSWFLARQALCFNILHQKMGLFHHSNPTHPRRSMVHRDTGRVKIKESELSTVPDVPTLQLSTSSTLTTISAPAASPTAPPPTPVASSLHHAASAVSLSVSLRPAAHPAHPAQSPPPSPGSSTSSLSLSHKFRLNNIRFFVEPTGPGRAKKEVIPSSPKVIASPPPVLARGGVLVPNNMRSYLQMRSKVQRPGAPTAVITPEKKEEKPKASEENGSPATATSTSLSHTTLTHALSNTAPFHLEFGSLLKGLYPLWDTWDTLVKEGVGKDVKTLDFSTSSPFASPYSRYSPHSPLEAPQSLLFSDVIDPFQFHGRQMELLVAARTYAYAELQQNEENFVKWQPIAAGIQKEVTTPLPFLSDVCSRAKSLQVIRVPLVFSDSESWDEASLSAVLVSYQRDYTQYLDHQLQAHVVDSGRMDVKQSVRRRRADPEVKVEEGIIEMRGTPTTTPSKVLMFKVIGGYTVFLQINFEFSQRRDDEPKVNDIFTCLNLSIAPFRRLDKRFEAAWKSISRGQVTLRQNRDLKKNSMVIGAEALQQDFINGIISSCELLHINSLTYDFHLRHIMNCVLDTASIYPEFDLKEALSTFSRFYPVSPSHSRNTLLHRTRHFPLASELVSQFDFFSYITRNATQYGINIISHRRNRNAVFCIASSASGDYFGDLKLRPDSDVDSSGGGPPSLGFCSMFTSKYVYLMLVFLRTPVDIVSSDLLLLSFDDSCDKGHYIALEYFLIQVDRTNIFPRSHLRSDIPDANLESILAAGEATLKRKLSSAFTHYQRDEVWSRIVNSSSNRRNINIPRKSLSPFHGTIEDNTFSELKDFSEFDYEIFRSLTLRRPLDVVDGSLSNLTSVGMSDLGNGLGRPLFDYLCKLYGPDCRLLIWQGWRHLFIACRHDKDVILHVIIHIGVKFEGRRGAFASTLEGDCGQSQFKVFVCRRVLDQRGGLESLAEKEMVEYFTNHVCHFLWEQMVHWLAG